ncbi:MULTISPECIES: class I SAM-dependent methyltransferase [Rhodobacterales]|mgnify:CR=1 FL=1|uniref:class I SAM-dependent methyltransferase n=1 Tax=Rhodobacterales TaxID=204455 RepID=UPI000B52925E|nr:MULTISPECIES: class I SAM-dependent methyltransferase [Rhodobacterales]
MKDLPVYADELIPLMQALDLGGARVLDLGCGNGGLSRRIAREAAAAHVTGIDAEAAQIARAVEKDAPAVFFLQGRGEALPLKTASMDAAIMMKSLHHVPIPSMDTALAELARLLRPGGPISANPPMRARSTTFCGYFTMKAPNAPRRWRRLSAAWTPGCS